MAERELVIKISAKNLTEQQFKQVQTGLTGIGRAAGDTNTKTGLLSRGFTSFGQAAPGALKIVTGAAAATAAAVVGVTAAVVKLGERGAVVGDVKAAFGDLAAAAGETGDAMLSKLSAGVKGTLSDFDLMKIANTALSAGLLKTSDDAGTLAEGARLLAKRTGGDTSQAFQTLITAMASGRTASLKQLGLFVDNKKAVEDYAEGLGKSVSDLSDFERATALQAGTLDALRTELGNSGAPLADFGELIESGKVGVKNLVDELAVMISDSPVLLAGMNAAADAISSAFGGESEGLVLGIVNAIERAALFAIEFGKAGITGAELVTRGFAGIKVLVLGVALGLSELDMRMKEVAASTLETAASIPGIGPMYEDNAIKARAAADASGELNASLREQIADAAVAAAGNDALGVSLEAGRAVLDSIGTSMTNAGFSQRSLNQAVAEGTTVVTNMGTSIGTAKFKLEEISPVMVDWQGKLVESGTETQAWEKIMDSAFAEASEANQSFGASVVGVGDLVGGANKRAEESAKKLGITTREESKNTENELTGHLQAIIDKYGEYSEEAIAAQQKVDEFRIESSEGAGKSQIASMDTVMTGTTDILGQQGAKHKSAAIAGALISTYQAIAKALAASPWPANLIPAAAAGAAGFLQVSKIKSSEPGFADGTSRLDYQSFGMGARAMLHGNEAVIPQGRGHILADEIARAMDARRGPSMDTAAVLEELRYLRASNEDLPVAIGRSLRDAMLLAR
jgi:hypothetical protein